MHLICNTLQDWLQSKPSWN